MSSQTRKRDDRLFTFLSNFWVNLHHFVRGEARRRTMKFEQLLPPSAFSNDERTAWNGALDAYAEFGAVSLIFDERLTRINNALALRTETAALPSGIVEPGITAALNAAAPVYRSHRWDQDNRANQQWIAKFRPKFLKALEQNWQPHLDGKTSFAAALSAVVRDAAQ